MSKDTERLYNCPDCDEYIEESEFEDHRRECDGIEKPWQMNDGELQAYVQRRHRTQPHWEDRFEKIFEAHRELMRNWSQSRMGSPSSHYNNGRYEVAAALPSEYDHSPSLRYRDDIVTNTRIYRIVVNLPPWLKSDEASALCWEQLFGQWPVIDKITMNPTPSFRSATI